MVEGKQRAESSMRPWMWAVILIVFSTLVRIGLWLVYQPIEYSDSGAYFRLAAALQDFNLSGYDGTRVPGYPLFIAILRQDPVTIWIAQMNLGVLTSILLFWITCKTVGRSEVGFAIGILYAVFPATLFFEANLLTESLTIFLITFSLGLFLAYQWVESRSGKLALVAMLGICAGIVGLVRPIFFPLSLWFLPFVWFAGGRNYTEKLTALSLYAVFPLLMQGSWLYYMKDHYHVISPTAIAGYSMVQHSGEFFEDLPDEYATIRDVYIKYREAQIATRGTQNNAIWQAVPELTESTDLSFYELSRQLYDLSWKLIREHPVGYAANVVEGWIWFWKAPVYWRADLVSNPALRSAMQVWALLGRGLAITVNFAFLLICFALVISQKVRAWVKIDSILILVGGFIGWTSILQSLFEHADNPRYLVPLQMIVIYFVVRSIFTMRRSLVELE